MSWCKDSHIWALSIWPWSGQLPATLQGPHLQHYIHPESNQWRLSATDRSWPNPLHSSSYGPFEHAKLPPRSLLRKWFYSCDPWSQEPDLAPYDSWTHFAIVLMWSLSQYYMFIERSWVNTLYFINWIWFETGKYQPFLLQVQDDSLVRHAHENSAQRQDERRYRCGLGIVLVTVGFWELLDRSYKVGPKLLEFTIGWQILWNQLAWLFSVISMILMRLLKKVQMRVNNSMAFRSSCSNRPLQEVILTSSQARTWFRLAVASLSCHFAPTFSRIWARVISPK